MTGDRIPAKVLAAHIIPNADGALLKKLGVKEGHRSLAVLATDCDDVSYTALDEATKKAVTKRSFSKSYHFSLYGYSNLLTAAVDLSTGKTVTNRAGNDLAKYFRKLFDARKGE